jgi:ABC-type maltose transport system permease subunit
MTPLIRKIVLLAAVLAFGAAWTGVVIAYFLTDSIAVFTVAVTFAALASEALIWALAIIGGWTLFANRRRFWKRLTGGSGEAG